MEIWKRLTENKVNLLILCDSLHKAQNSLCKQLKIQTATACYPWFVLLSFQERKSSLEKKYKPNLRSCCGPHRGTFVKFFWLVPFWQCDFSLFHYTYLLSRQESDEKVYPKMKKEPACFLVPKFRNIAIFVTSIKVMVAHLYWWIWYHRVAVVPMIMCWIYCCCNWKMF